MFIKKFKNINNYPFPDKNLLKNDVTNKKLRKESVLRSGFKYFKNYKFFKQIKCNFV